MLEFIFRSIEFIFISNNPLLYIFVGLFVFAAVQVVRRCFL